MTAHAKVRWFVLSLFASPAILATHASAHVGHGLDTRATGLLHYALDPAHGGVVALCVVVGLAATWVTLRRRRS